MEHPSELTSVVKNRAHSRNRKRYTRAERTAIVGSYRQSGLNRIDFCKQENLCISSLGRWLKELQTAGAAPKGQETVRLIEVAAKNAPSPGQSTTRYRLGFGGALHLELEAGFNPQEASFLCRLLRETSGC